MAAHGGSSKVAAALGWPAKTRLRRPNGYWDDIDNVKRELLDFIEEAASMPGALHGRHPCGMPARSRSCWWR